MDNSEAEFIKERVLIKKEQLTREGMAVPEDKELIRETIEEKIEESLKNYSPSIVTAPTPIITTSVSVDEDEQEAQNKVKELAKIALNDNISKAVTMALKTGNAYLIDKLHDTLVDKYYQILKNQKVI